MVEPIGIKPVTTVDRMTVSRVEAPQTPQRVAANVADARSPVSSAATAEASAAAVAPPVDSDRVAQIKAAIANGTFPILPAKIADAMIALKLDWMSNK